MLILRVEREHVAVARDDQRVHLDEARVALEVQLVEAARDRLELRDLRAREPEAVRERAAMRALQPGGRVDLDTDDLLRRLRRDFLDVHAAGRRGDERDAAAVAIEQQAQVQLALDLRAGLDVDLVDRQPLGPGLLGREPLAEHACRGCRDVADGLDDLDAAGLAAAARVHLRLDHPEAAAEAARGVRGLFGRRGDEAGRHRDAVTGEELLGLVFVQVHAAASGGVDEARYSTG